MDAFVCPLDCLPPISICTDIVSPMFTSYNVHVSIEVSQSMCAYTFERKRGAFLISSLIFIMIALMPGTFRYRT